MSPAAPKGYTTRQKGNNLGEFEDKSTLKAHSANGTAPTLSVSVDKAWIAAVQLLSFQCRAGVLDKYEDIKLFLEASLIPV